MFTGIVEFAAPVISLLNLEANSNGKKITQLKIGVPLSFRRGFSQEEKLPPLSLKTKAFARSFSKRNSPNLDCLHRSTPNLGNMISSNEDRLGDSISINGCCLTIVRIDNQGWTFEISSETLQITTLGTLQMRDLVNVERAMLPQTRFGGHFVSGHVDCRGLVHQITEAPDGWIVSLEVPKPFDRFCVPKGSITVNGVSLTINRVEEKDAKMTFIELCLIPITLEVTNLKSLSVGKYVNIEVDQIVKMFDRLKGTL
jgi:riboflavin synthase